MENIEELFSPQAVESMREEIAGAGGAEVFFVGESMQGRRVGKVRTIARGNHAAVPAIMEAARPGEVVIHNHPSGKLKPSNADLSTASALGNNGVGFYIIDNHAGSAYVVVESFFEEEAELLDTAELVSMMEPGGPISRTLDTYEHRPQQGEMIEVTARAFNRDGIALIEAGTGTGKTMAYLIPAIKWATDNGERVIISTHTINLQEQLMHKDIPFLRRALGIEFKAVQALGRGNYLCLRKSSQLDKEPELFIDPEESDHLALLLQWAEKTTSGCRTELSYVPPADLWEKLCSESDYCMGSRCPDNKRCFVNMARRKASTADLLVVNHHLLFADTALRSLEGRSSDIAILPHYQRLIMDEAHNIEDVATSYFGTRITKIGFVRMLGRLYNPTGGGKGLLPYTAAILRKQEGNGEALAGIIDELEKRLISEVRELAADSDATFNAVMERVAAASKQEQPELKLRLTPQVVDTVEWRELLDTQVLEFTAKLISFAGELTKIAKKLTSIMDDTIADQCFDLRASADRLEAFASDFKRILAGDNNFEVTWVEGRLGGRGRHVVRLFSSPVDISTELGEALFHRVATVILTSATLTVNNSFHHFRSRLGLPSPDEEDETGRMEEQLLPSPFDYLTQVVIGIPTDIPEPSEGIFDQSISGLIYDTLEITGGKAFVLFTSYKSLDWVHGQLKGPLSKLGITALRQGERPRHMLLEMFKKDRSSALFATDSFWQGVDVEGEALECVIMVKLPFRVPTEPVLEARCQRIEVQGGNPFMDYIVPQAVIKFKQGFGRLIRRKTDRGAVLILDRRIVEKSYGKLFMKSLPPCNFTVGTTDEMLQALREFYGEAR